MTIRLIFGWFAFISLLSLVSPDNILVADVFYGLIFLWVTASVLYMGYYVSSSAAAIGRQKRAGRNIVIRQSRLAMLGMSASAVVISVAISQYYTGSSPDVVMGGLLNSESLYSEYQQYFSEEGVGDFTVAKIPYVLGGVYIKFCLFFIASCIACSVELNKRIAISAFFVSLAHLYFSIARGTSFEIFEVLLLFMFVFIVRRKFVLRENIFSTRSIVLGIVGILAALTWYSYNIDARGGEATCTLSGICVDSSSYLHSLDAGLGDLLYRLGTYFTFGIYFASEALAVASDTAESVIMFMLPGASFIAYEHGFVTEICDRYLECGVSWVPDSIRLLSVLGLVGYFYLLYQVGRLISIVEGKIGPGSVAQSMLLFVVFYVMISLPVGKFVSTSSANYLSVVLILGLHLSGVFRRRLLQLFGVGLQEAVPSSSRSSRMAAGSGKGFARGA